MGVQKYFPGQKFGRLTITEILPNARCQCLCDCGNTTTICRYSLGSGLSKSCGCLRKELITRHGDTRSYKQTTEYRIWACMISRCGNQNDKGWYRYGGRGITVCEEWRRDYSSFLADVGRRPTRAHSLDRINNDGNYEPGNVRWATRSQQRRNNSENTILEVGGRRMCLADWAEEVGLGRECLRGRLRLGWPPEEALFTKLGATRGSARQRTRTEETNAQES